MGDNLHERLLGAVDSGNLDDALKARGGLQALQEWALMPEIITTKLEELLATRNGQPERDRRVESERTAHRTNSRWLNVGRTPDRPGVGEGQNR